MEPLIIFGYWALVLVAGAFGAARRNDPRMLVIVVALVSLSAVLEIAWLR